MLSPFGRRHRRTMIAVRCEQAVETCAVNLSRLVEQSWTVLLVPDRRTGFAALVQLQVRR